MNAAHWLHGLPLANPLSEGWERVHHHPSLVDRLSPIRCRSGEVWLADNCEPCDGATDALRTCLSSIASCRATADVRAIVAYDERLFDEVQASVEAVWNDRLHELPGQGWNVRLMPLIDFIQTTNPAELKQHIHAGVVCVSLVRSEAVPTAKLVQWAQTLEETPRLGKPLVTFHQVEVPE